MSIDTAMQQLDTESLRIMESAARLCMQRCEEALSPEHFVAAALDESVAVQELAADSGFYWRLPGKAAGEPGSRGVTPVLSVRFLKWLRIASEYTRTEFEGERVSPAALLYSLAAHPEALVEDARLQQALAGAKRSALYRAACAEAGVTTAAFRQPDTTALGPEMSGTEGGNDAARDALAQFCQNLCQDVAEGRLDPVMCREKEIAQLIDILCRRKKNNPMILGEAGTGKTALVEGLAWWIHEERVPPALMGVEVYALDLGALKAGASVRGELERRVKTILDALKVLAGQALLFIDEAHTLLAADGQGGDDLANLLKPALARGEIKVIAATTWREYKKYFEKDPAMVRRFQPVTVQELALDQAEHVLRHVRPALEARHGVLIRDEAVCMAVSASHRFMADRMLPDKALDVLDTACVRVYLRAHVQPVDDMVLASTRTHLVQQLEGLRAESERGFDVADTLTACEAELRQLEERLDTLDKGDAGQGSRDDRSDSLVVTAADVADVIAGWTGIPRERILSARNEAIQHAPARLRDRLIGQDHAIERVFRRLQASAAGLTDARQPQGVFLFTGPSGVGKTELARLLAQEICGHDRALLRINMSEYQESHSVSRLIGSPPGYVGYGEGGVLTEAVRKNPWSVVLLDEVEKAHRDVHSLFYQVFDSGFLNDGEGRPTDFRNTIVILTANLAADAIQSLWQQSPEMSPDEVTERIWPQLVRVLPPALLGRMDVIPFRPLSLTMAATLVQRRFESLAEQAMRHGIRLELAEPAVSALAGDLVSSPMGVRYLHRLVERHWVPRVSDAILESHPEIVVLEWGTGGLARDEAHSETAPAQ